MVERRWTIPQLTPIIEVNPEPNPKAPFVNPDPNWKPVKVYNANQLKRWFQDNGIEFPPNSKITHHNDNKGSSVITIKNTPNNLEIVDGVLSALYPAHTSLQLMRQFLQETENVPLEKLIPTIRKYPGQTIGPLRNLIEEFSKFDKQLAVKLDPNLKKIVSLRRDQLKKRLPKAVQATRSYFETMVKTMETPE
ncbi:MAG: hypothetical protein PVJ98_06310 [Akkermansiaceae bacterium]